ncbi:MAG: hypothetical protein ABIP79_09285 [Chitinophagaceae bacterium]
MKPLILFLLAAITLTSCTNYGKKVKSSNIEVYYNDGITEDQAQKTADYIYKLDTDPETKDNKKSFQLNKDGDTINCKMVVNEEKFKDIPVSSFEAIGGLISANVFDGKPVNMILSTNKFKPLQTVYFKKMEKENTNLSKYGEKTTSGNIEVYVTEQATMEDGEALALLLEKEMNPTSIISFQLTKDDNGLNTVRMVSSEEKSAKISDQTLTDMCATISDGVFKGSPLVFDFTDSQFNTIKTFTYDPE